MNKLFLSTNIHKANKLQRFQSMPAVQHILLTIIEYNSSICSSSITKKFLNHQIKRFSSKVFPTAAAAVADITDGSTLLVGGFGLCGRWILILFSKID